MKKNNVWIVAISNIIILLTSLILNFFIPRFFSVENYADYKTYTLYVGYTGLFHLGYINGIYLKYGSLDYTELPYDKFKRYTKVLLCMEGLITLILWAVGYLLCGQKWITMPLAFVVLNIFALNFKCYFSLIDQFTQRFFLDSVLQVMYNMGLLLTLLVLVKNVDADEYLLIITLVNYFSVFTYVLFNKEIVGISKFNLTDYKDEIRELISRGKYVMLSELMGMIILGIDSIIIQMFGSKYQFSMYSFAISVITIEYALINIFANLIFPYLMRISSDKYVENYKRIKVIVLIGFLVLLPVLLVMLLIIDYLLPNYTESKSIIIVLAISILIRGWITLAQSNFYKVLKKEKVFFNNNIAACVLCIITDIIAWIIWNNTIAIAIASVVTYIIWYIYSDIQLRKYM